MNHVNIFWNMCKDLYLIRTLIRFLSFILGRCVLQSHLINGVTQDGIEPFSFLLPSKIAPFLLRCFLDRIYLGNHSIFQMAGKKIDL